jgi:uncharacterized membrane protein
LTLAVLRVRVRRYLIAGLVLWVPILVTVLVVRFILELMDNVLLLMPPALRPETLFGVHIPGIGALVGLVLLLLTGVLVSNMIGRSLVGLWEDLLNRIPFIRAIYSGVKSFSSTVLSSSSKSFKKVVMVEYPRKGVWTIAFQTAADLPWLRAQSSDEPQVCVFVPTTPNPTAGFILLLPRSQVIELDMSIDEAMKLIVTLGVVVPDSPVHAAGPGALSTAGSSVLPSAPTPTAAPIVPAAPRP